MIVDLESCLTSLGAKKPFRANGDFTDEGYKAYNKLCELLTFMQENSVVESYDEDRLDRLFSGPAY